jgi:dipeptidyl aminopeptidase/acylaminoacyl peptidase
MLVSRAGRLPEGLRWRTIARPAALLAGCLLAFVVMPSPADEITLADFARHAQYEDVKISPDGEHLAATALVNGKRVLALIRVADMKRIDLDPRDFDEIADFWWIGPRRVVYSVGKKFADLETPLLTGELYAADADSSGRSIIAGVRNYGGFRGVAQVMGRVPGDSKRLLVATTPWGRESENLFTSAQLIDGSGSLQRLATAPMHHARFVADNSGEIRFAYAENGDLALKVYYRTPQSPQWELLFDAARGDPRLRPVRFSRDDGSVYFVCPGDGGVGGVCRWDVATRKMQTLWSGTDSEPIELLDTLDGRDAFAIRSMPGRPELTLIDPQAREAALMHVLMQQFPGQDVRMDSSTADGAKIIVHVSSDRNPGEFHLYDAVANTTTFLLASQPWISAERMAEVAPIKLEARDGMPLHGYLTRPRGSENGSNLPLVVLVHGGPYGEHDSWEYDATVQTLASRGYAVLQINYRGSGGYGAAFVEAGLRQWGGAMQDDVTDATRWTIAQGIADPQRICIFGNSYGGYAALMGAEKEPDLYKCAIGYVGVYDLRMMYKRGDIPQTVFGKNYLKRTLGENQEELYDRSPIAHVDRLKASVMLIVGGSDLRVPAAQGKRMHAALRDRNIEHEWLYRRNEAHGFYNEGHVAEMYGSVVAFLDRNIGRPAVAAGKDR